MGSVKLVAVGALVFLFLMIDAGESCRAPYSCISGPDCIARHGTNLKMRVIFRCGARGMKVCCPPDGLVKVMSTPSDADPRQHANYHFLPTTSCGTTKSPNRIKNGEDAQHGQFPWMALLGYEDKNQTNISFKCGATLINKNYVLTAAHCISRTRESGIPKIVRLGELNLDNETDCDKSNVCANNVLDREVDQMNIVIHPKFSDSIVNDIALIRLMEPIEESLLSTSLGIICLPIGLDNKYKDKKYRVSGWGKTSFNSMGSRTLQAAFVTSISNEECHQGVDYKVIETQLCTEGTLDATEACKGDSGGPLMDIARLKNDIPRTYQIGIVSFTLGSDADECASLKPGVYTRVAPYINWILDSMLP